MSLDGVAIAVIGKFPAAGKVKTRLTPTLSPEQAAAVHRVFFLHLVGRLHRLQPRELIVYFDPPDARDAMADLMAEFSPILVPQIPGDLGRRLAHIGSYAAKTNPRTLILAVDSPDVPTAHLARAADLTATADVSLGPAEDGGYWYLGLRNCVDTAALLHAEIDWSTERAAVQTLANAETLGYQTATGPKWDDVDQPEDLERLIDRLKSSHNPDDAALLSQLSHVLQVAPGSFNFGR